MNVHTDILKLCKTREKRELIKWFNARQIFFDSSFDDGLALARQSEHEDARFLVTLCPVGAPATKEEAAAIFLVHGDDARCLCWAAQCGAEPRGELLRRSAEGGCAWGQALFGWRFCAFGAKFAWMEKAVLQEEREAMYHLADRLWYGITGNKDKARARQLWLEAAYLGDAEAQFSVGRHCCVDGSLEQLVWWRRSAVQHARYSVIASLELAKYAGKHVHRFDLGGSGRIVFELGAAFQWHIDSGNGRVHGVKWSNEDIVAAERAVALHDQWCAEAKRALLCWIWVAHECGVNKDIRLVIANLIWDERAVWSEQRTAPTSKKALRCKKR